MGFGVLINKTNILGSGKLGWIFFPTRFGYFIKANEHNQ